METIQPAYSQMPVWLFLAILPVTDTVALIPTVTLIPILTSDSLSKMGQISLQVTHCDGLISIMMALLTKSMMRVQSLTETQRSTVWVALIPTAMDIPTPTQIGHRLTMVQMLSKLTRPNGAMQMAMDLAIMPQEI
jgi:hypothetical protein